MVEKLTKSERKSRRKRRFLRTLVVTVGLLIMIRIALPFVILRTINKELEVLPTYTCVVQDISMSLIDQSITLKGIKMTKKNGKIDVPFFVSGDINVFLESYEKRTVKVIVETCILIINIYKGRMDGFIDPVAKNLVFHKDYDKEKPKLGKRIKQSLLDGVSKLLGREEEKIETRIELHGTMGEVKVDVWEIVSEGLKNSFIVGAPKED